MNGCFRCLGRYQISRGSTCSLLVCVFIVMAGWGIMRLSAGFWQTRRSQQEKIWVDEKVAAATKCVAAREYVKAAAILDKVPSGGKDTYQGKVREVYQKLNEARAAEMDEQFRNSVEQAEILNHKQEKDRERRAGERRAQIPSAPVYRELMEFVVFACKKNKTTRERLDREDQELLIRFLEAKGNKNQGQSLESNVQAQGTDAPESLLEKFQEEMELLVSNKRAVMKERFRTNPEFSREDWPIFDKQVDQILDGLLEEIKEPFATDGAERMRFLNRPHTP